MRMEKEIAGYEGKYYVSSSGSVFKSNGLEVGQWMSDQGYMLVRLSSPRKTLRVHRLVAEAFIPNPDSLPFVNHIDCIRHNNKFENLEWCTQKQNLYHSDSLGRMKRDYWKGKRSPNAKITDEVAEAIRICYSSGRISLESVGKNFGVSKRTVGRIVNNESYN